MGGIAAVIAAQRVRRERELVAHLRALKALTAVSATELRPQQRMGEAVLQKLIDEHAVLRTDAGLYWLDEAAYLAMRSRRMRFVAWMVPIAVIAGLTLAIGVSMVAPK